MRLRRREDVEGGGRDADLHGPDGGRRDRIRVPGARRLGRYRHVRLARGDSTGSPELAHRFLLGGANRSGAHRSPDGRRIVFETTRGIEAANADASGRRLPVREESARFFFGDPDWSPDGREIVLTGATWSPLTWPRVPEQIYVMRSNGTGLRPLTGDVAAADRVPRWSPDGSVRRHLLSWADGVYGFS